jgi:hypothetical protein
MAEEMGREMVKGKGVALAQIFVCGYFRLGAGMENVLFLVPRFSHEFGLVGVKESALFQRLSPCKHCEQEMVSALEFFPWFQSLGRAIALVVGLAIVPAPAR